mmetsp:Transcript_29575/g.34009  ORF Transcript_29575/g.34009 Transcript_29575/m.34009 type:complete len:230 (-) Transcript_29575:197-886(-)
MAEPGASTKWMRHQVLVRSKSNSSGNSSGSNDGISGNSSNGDNDNNKNSNEEEKGKEYTIQGFHDLHSSSRVSVTTSSSTSTSSSSSTSIQKLSHDKRVQDEQNIITETRQIAETTFEMTRMIQQQNGNKMEYVSHFKYYRQPILIRIGIDQQLYSIQQPFRGDGYRLDVVKQQKRQQQQQQQHQQHQYDSGMNINMGMNMNMNINMNINKMKSMGVTIILSNQFKITI